LVQNRSGGIKGIFLCEIYFWTNHSTTKTLNSFR